MAHRKRVYAIAALVWMLFIAYGSLIPFHYQAHSSNEAWSAYLGIAANSLRLSLTDLATNIVLFVPIAFCLAGYLAMASRTQAARFGALIAFISCSVLAALVEFAQVFFPPRTSSVYDLAGNILGAGLGSVLWRMFENWTTSCVESIAKVLDTAPARNERMRRWAIVAVVAYVIVVAATNGWFSLHWLPAGDAQRHVTAIRLLPFYHHQEASIFVSIVSVAVYAALYLPVGSFCWWFLRTPERVAARLWLSAAAGGGLAAVIESGKFFLPGKGPDTGNIFIAMLASMTGLVAAAYVQYGRRASPARLAAAKNADAIPVQSSPVLARIAAFFIAAGVTIAVSRFPIHPTWLGAGLAVYAVVLVRWPHAWLWVLPGMLPVVDLAPLSGWFYFDEFDLAVLTTLSVSLWRGPRLAPQGAPKLGRWLLALLVISVVSSTVRGLLPLQPLDWNAFASYYSHYNALRVAKGFLWPVALVVVASRCLDSQINVPKHFALGVLIGLAGAVAIGIQERYRFPGLFDFAREFRLGSILSSEHHGGDDTEAYLALATPFAVAGAYLLHGWVVRAALGALFAGATYVMMMTFSRGGYAGYGLAIAVVMLLLGRFAMSSGKLRGFAVVGVALAISLVVAGSVLSEKFAQQRWAAAESDLEIRIAHWKDALRMMDSGPMTELLGMGLGRYPETYLFRTQEGRAPTTYRFETEADNVYLRLGSGQPLYVEQIVDVVPNQFYQLTFDSRSEPGPTSINVLVCARTYFHSYGCQSASFDFQSTAQGWSSHQALIHSRSLGEGNWLTRRPVKISLENASQRKSVDIDNVQFLDGNGKNLVVNGDFASGTARWFTSASDHLPWHIKNFWIAILFDLGWLGVLVLACVIVKFMWCLALRAWRGDSFAAAAFASSLGFLSVGLFGSLVDAPRVMTMFLLTLFLGGDVVWLRASVPTDRASRSRLDEFVPVPSSGAWEPVALWPAIRHAALCVGIGAVLIGLITRLPFMPYNMRDLPNPYHPLAAPILLAAFFWWIFAVPAWMARSLAVGGRVWFLFPIAVALHGVIAWAVVRYAVLPEMIHKVTGSPVLRWPWTWETLGRFVALDAALIIPLTGVGVLMLTYAGRAKFARTSLIWILWATVLLIFARWVVVTNAATDNLTELMAGGGTVTACVLLALWVMSVGAGAAALSCSFARDRFTFAKGLVVAVLSIPIGFALLWSATESVVEKFGTAFSALQFLLSTDRAHYAEGWELGARYLGAHLALLGSIAICQWPAWTAGRAPSQRKSAADHEVGKV